MAPLNTLFEPNMFVAVLMDDVADGEASCFLDNKSVL